MEIRFVIFHVVKKKFSAIKLCFVVAVGWARLVLFCWGFLFFINCCCVVFCNDFINYKAFSSFALASVEFVPATV